MPDRTDKCLSNFPFVLRDIFMQVGMYLIAALAPAIEVLHGVGKTLRILMFHLTAAAIAPYILKEMQFYQPQH
jgi:hypothetical protein